MLPEPELGDIILRISKVLCKKKGMISRERQEILHLSAWLKNRCYSHHKQIF